MNNGNKENKGLGRADLARLLRAREAAGQAEQWQPVLLEMEREYPGIDVQAGLQKPAVRTLLRAGVDFRTAFEAANLEEIRAQIAARAEQEMVDRMAVNAGRAKNGIAAAKASPFAAGAGQMSKSDREEIVRRVLRGEEIRL